MPAFRFNTAILIVAAIITQFVTSRTAPGFQPANFFSYFTIQSNIFAACVLLAAAARGSAPPDARFEFFRGADVLCLSLTGLVFSILLAKDESDLIPWVNLMLHYLAPIVVVADWVIDPPKTRLGPRDALLWLTVPLVYVAYTLIRGASVHWYPYPFLNVDVLGYGGVLRYALAIFAGLLAAAFAIVWIGNLRSSETSAR